MKKTILLLSCFVTFSFAKSAQSHQVTTPPKPRAKPKIVSAAQVNGLYRLYKSEFRILALGHQRLRVQFDGICPTPKSFNNGYAAGEALIEGNVATFKPPDSGPCEMTLVFLRNKLKVTQKGSDLDCGFGHNVNATGTYRKIRGGKPKFESPP